MTTPNTDSRTRYHFDLNVILDDTGNLYGVEMTCSMCGDIGYKRPQELWKHALTCRTVEDPPFDWEQECPELR